MPDNILVTVAISGAGTVFVLDRLIALVKALRGSDTARSGQCDISHERLQGLVERLADNNDTLTDILREMSQGISILLDRRQSRDTPARSVDLVRVFEERQKSLNSLRPKKDDPR